MNDEKIAYSNLTGIDIDEQRRIWDERGKGYYGEYLVFCTLYKNIIGNCKLLMNLTIPTEASGKTEIDLLMIHETGIYVFEIKHYKGMIYGSDTDNIWTQYFRTAKNHCFNNPILQNGYHMRALKKMISNAPIYSVVIFTSDECILKIQNRNPDILVTTLSELPPLLDKKLRSSNIFYSAKKIDELFVMLSEYSPMKKDITHLGTALPFSSWLQPIIRNMQSKIIDLDIQIANVKRQSEQNSILERQRMEQYNKATAKLHRRLFTGIAIVLMLAILSVISFAYKLNDRKNEQIANINKSCREQIEVAESRLNDLQNKFEHVDETGNQYLKSLLSFTAVSDVSLYKQIEEAVSFTAKVALTAKDYGIKFTSNAKYIVMTESGKVFEYNVFDDSYSHQGSTLLFNGRQTEITFERRDFYGIENTSDITYIKITGIYLCRQEDMNIHGDIYKYLSKDLELELYAKKS